VRVLLAACLAGLAAIAGRAEAQPAGKMTCMHHVRGTAENRLVTWDGQEERVFDAPDIVEWRASLFGDLLVGGVEWGPLTAYSLAR